MKPITIKTLHKKVVDRGCEIISIGEDIVTIKCRCGGVFKDTIRHLKNLRSNVKDGGNKLGCDVCKNIWTNNRIDIMLITRNNKYKRVTDISAISSPSTTKIDWQCEECNYIWSASVDQIYQSNSSCPQCAGSVPYNIETLQNKLDIKNNNIKVVDLYDGNKDSGRKGRFQCDKGHEWIANIHNVIKFNYGCPYCNYNFGCPSTSSDGNKFHSKLEMFAYNQFKKCDNNFIMQHRYSCHRKHTCDFYFPDSKKWIEICGERMLTIKKYADTIEYKKNLVENVFGETFVLLKNHSQIIKFSEELL